MNTNTWGSGAGRRGLFPRLLPAQGSEVEERPDAAEGLDLYGHLFPGNENKAAALLDAYIEAERERAADAARGARAELSDAQTGAKGAHGASIPRGTAG